MDKVNKLILQSEHRVKLILERTSFIKKYLEALFVGILHNWPSDTNNIPGKEVEITLRRKKTK